MARVVKVADILKKIGNDHLALYRGDGYWYFIYDDGTAHVSHSVSVMYLNHLSIERWVHEGTVAVVCGEAAAKANAEYAAENPTGIIKLTRRG